MNDLEIEDFNEKKETDIEKAARDKLKKTGQEKEKKAEAMSSVKEIFSWVVYFAAAIIIALLIKNYLIINAHVPTGSMENTIMPGDRLIGNRLAYLKEEPNRGDIVVFRYPDDETQTFVKRVIGLPGETVEIRDAHIYIDGSTEPLAEDYLKEDWIVAAGPYTFDVPEGCYLMLGDNRNDSWDARYWTNTYVEEDQILGEALFTYWPFKNFGKLR